MAEDQRIISIDIEDQMKTSYIDYSMSVIVARALPDVRDGLKPVHRRVLYGMDDLGVQSNKPHKKSARIVGEVLGKYHPHGDSSVYDAMVRMAQYWSLRYPLVDGQGNFGSMDGDSPAAMRYTEARFTKITEEFISDLDKETVDFKFNFDDSLEEPTVLPTRFPNLLVNGSSGIAVGMATNMLPHNLREVCDGIIATVDNEDITIAELMQYIKAPDFPTGGTIYGYDGVVEAFETGRGKIIVRGKTEIEEISGREAIIISEIPYQVNKAHLVAKIAELVNEEKILGISDVRDESDRTGIRVVIEIKRDAIARVVLSQLFKFTPLQSSYGVNNIALINGRPYQLNVKDLIREFIRFRLEVIVRRTTFDLRKAEERAHILEGLLIALDHLDEVIALIRASANAEIAKEGLMSTFNLSDIQAKAILEMRLQRLTGLERDKIREEYNDLMKVIEDLKSILADEGKRKSIVKKETLEIKERFGDARRTEISYADGEINIEDMIPEEDVVVTISHLGYIKRTSVSEFRIQGRGGRGSRGAKTRDEDFIDNMFVAGTHNYLLLFTSAGRCYWLKVYELPEASKGSAGRVIQNLVNIPADEKVRAYIIIKNLSDKDFIQNNYILFCTRNGIIKKSLVEDFSRPRTSGINAITINEGDELLEAKLTTGKDEVVIASRRGLAIRFNESRVRPMGRGAAGVIGIRLEENEGDAVIGLVCANTEDTDQTILVVSAKGNGKRSNIDDYRITNRGGKGVKTMNISEKTGDLVTIKLVKESDQLMITNRSGIIIRMAVNEMRVMGRNTQGVRIIRIDEHDSIADVAVVYEGVAVDDPETMNTEE